MISRFNERKQVSTPSMKKKGKPVKIKAPKLPRKP
jgi:hypothetical protein